MEGKNIEQHHEILPQPSVDIRSTLEKGEIESTETLEGFFPIKEIKIKDDGRGIFRPDGFRFEQTGKVEDLRSDLELLAFSVDEALGFNLVPPVVSRNVEGKTGTMQYLVESARPAYYVPDWPDLVSSPELIKAAVFDYVLDTRDRHSGNFLVDPKLGKIWLIDHDYMMFMGSGLSSDIWLEAERSGLTRLDEEIRASAGRFIASIDSLTVEAKPEVVGILEKAKQRTLDLLETGEIPRIPRTSL